MIKKFKGFLKEASEKELKHFNIVKILFIVRICVYIATLFVDIQDRCYTVDSVFWLFGVTVFLGYSLYDEEKSPNIWRILSGAFFYNVVINVLALFMLMEQSNAKFGIIIPIPVHYVLICLLDLACVYILRLNSGEFKEKQRCQKAKL